MHPESDFIRLSGLSKSYREGERKRIVLDHASACFARGEFMALLGRSGSGKSTLLNLVSGIDRPDAGEVWVGPQELTRLSEHERTLFRRRHIGFIFQFFNLIPTLTVMENVTLPLELSGASVQRRANGGGTASGRRGPARSGRDVSRPVVGRRAAARRDRPRLGPRPDAGIGRRADRQPG